jgi:glutamine amidotransferase-like uncharacterized protein
MTRLRLICITLFVLAIVITGAYFLYNAFDDHGAAVGNDPGLTPPEKDPSGEPDVAEPVVVDLADYTMGLYTGRGSWDVDVAALRNFLSEYELSYVEIDEEMIGKGDLNDLCDILIFVGGWSAQYQNYIENHANIRRYVEDGGCFVGFCAGAYYASSTMRWKGNPLDYPLKLFSGEAVGPLSLGWGTLPEIVLNSEIAFNTEFMDTLSMWYFDGPSFTGFPESDVHVLASYQFSGEAAVIAFPFGEGQVLLSGPHPELGYIPASGQVQTEGGDGAQWSWLYAALQWLASEKPV